MFLKDKNHLMVNNSLQYDVLNSNNPSLFSESLSHANGIIAK